MRERLDREVGQALKAAMSSARRSGADEMGGEHLLVGITEVPSRAAATLARLGVDSVRLEEAVSRGAHDARLLAGLGIDLAAVRRQVGDRSLVRWPTRRPSFRTDAKAAIVASRDEMQMLGSRRVRSDHLLLGLIRTSVAARELLLALEIDPMSVRRTVLKALAESG